MPKRRPKDPDAVAPARIKVVPRRGLNRKEAARYVGVSAPKFDKLVREGQMPRPFRIGKRTIWDLRKLDAAFDVLSGPEEAGSSTGWEKRDCERHPAETQAEIRATEIRARKAARRRSAEPSMSGEYPGYHNVYTVETLAERWKCSSTLVRNMIRCGRLEGFRYGGKLIRITAAAVFAYEKANPVLAKH
jgi:excisionase family DNA binding protein